MLAVRGQQRGWITLWSATKMNLLPFIIGLLTYYQYRCRGPWPSVIVIVILTALLVGGV